MLVSGDLARKSDALKRRHREILFFVCKGLRNAEIAGLLGISERTVKGYVSQLFLIFDVSNRTELAGQFCVSDDSPQDHAPPDA